MNFWIVIPKVGMIFWIRFRLAYRETISNNLKLSSPGTSTPLCGREKTAEHLNHFKQPQTISNNFNHPQTIWNRDSVKQLGTF